jgi:class 3 adenylate cyclase
VRAEERKVVTVLFCDLAGFTARSDQADPEDVRARLRPYHVRLRTEIERFGGTLDKFIGDGVMAVFGAPVAHEDDPERAVRAALRMLDAIAELNAGDPALALSVRIGITTGEAVVSLAAGNDSEGVVGDVVNTASRLEGVAPVGGVVVGEPTWRATRQLFDYRALEPVRVKGKAEPLALWQALAPRSRQGSEAGVAARTPYIGREAVQQTEGRRAQPHRPLNIGPRDSVPRPIRSCTVRRGALRVRKEAPSGSGGQSSGRSPPSLVSDDNCQAHALVCGEIIIGNRE